MRTDQHRRLASSKESQDRLMSCSAKIIISKARKDIKLKDSSSSLSLSIVQMSPAGSAASICEERDFLMVKLTTIKSDANIIKPPDIGINSQQQRFRASEIHRNAVAALGCLFLSWQYGSVFTVQTFVDWMVQMPIPIIFVFVCFGQLLLTLFLLLSHSQTLLIGLSLTLSVSSASVSCLSSTRWSRSIGWSCFQWTDIVFQMLFSLWLILQPKVVLLNYLPLTLSTTRQLLGIWQRWRDLNRVEKKAKGDLTGLQTMAEGAVLLNGAATCMIDPWNRCLSLFLLIMLLALKYKVDHKARQALQQLFFPIRRSTLKSPLLFKLDRLLGSPLSHLAGH